MPANGDVGSIEVKLTATDACRAAVSDVFTLTVTNTNDAPTLEAPIADMRAVEDVTFSYVVPPPPSRTWTSATPWR
jgi:hypothetical protein